jgi:hypothetical protein
MGHFTMQKGVKTRQRQRYCWLLRVGVGNKGKKCQNNYRKLTLNPKSQFSLLSLFFL